MRLCTRNLSSYGENLHIIENANLKGEFNVEQVRKLSTILMLFGVMCALSVSQTKLAQTGFNFLSVSSDAKASAMGDAVNSLSGFSGAMAHNPASMAEMPTFLSASFSINTWIADINYLSASIIVSPADGHYGNVGISVQSVDYGDIEGTMVDRNNPSSYIETGILNPTALAVGFGYSYMINKQFGVGGRVKYTFQELGENWLMGNNYGIIKKTNKATAMAYDFGTVYKTGVKSLAFGMSVTNFSSEVKFEQEGFQLPLLFTIGISANFFDFVDMNDDKQALILTVDWTHPRSHPEQIKLGAEYKFMDILSLRGGYVAGNDENDVTFGVGVSSFGIEVDYSYTPFGVFDSVQRFTTRFSL